MKGMKNNFWLVEGYFLICFCLCLKCFCCSHIIWIQNINVNSFTLLYKDTLILFLSFIKSVLAALFSNISCYGGSNEFVDKRLLMVYPGPGT